MKWETKTNHLQLPNFMFTVPGIKLSVLQTSDRFNVSITPVIMSVSDLISFFLGLQVTADKLLESPSNCTAFSWEAKVEFDKSHLGSGHWKPVL